MRFQHLMQVSLETAQPVYIEIIAANIVVVGFFWVLVLTSLTQPSHRYIGRLGERKKRQIKILRDLAHRTAE